MGMPQRKPTPTQSWKRNIGRSWGTWLNRFQTKEYARTGKRMDGCGDGRVLGPYGCDELNNNGKGLLTFAKDNKLALTNTFFSARWVEFPYVQRHQQPQRPRLHPNPTSKPISRVWCKGPPPASAPSQGGLRPLYRLRDGPPQRSFCLLYTSPSPRD